VMSLSPNLDSVPDMPPNEKGSRGTCASHDEGTVRQSEACPSRR
jgi:hypothetical protein